MAGMVILVLTGALLAGGWQFLLYFARTPGSTISNPSVIILNFPRGTGLRRISRQLAAHRLITSAFLFELLARMEKKDRQLKAGEYALSRTMSPEEILDTLCSGKVKRYRITIPEGFTMAEISGHIRTSGLGPRPDFMHLARDAAFCATLDIKANQLEGYLFPETYFFEKSATTADIITTMVQRFRLTFPPQWRQRARDLGMSVHQVVTLASIIEKETGAPQERPLISSVFHNRLKKRMRLQSDPTVIYGIADFNGNLTRRDLNTPTPYNTYQIPGLPPGPIANPGRDALEAALYPAHTDYLFFVSKKDHTHHFSNNLKAHNRAVRHYQLGR